MIFTKNNRIKEISSQNTQSGNPILPFDELICDVEARVYTDRNGEERVYLYGSCDEFGSVDVILDEPHNTPICTLPVYKKHFPNIQNTAHLLLYRLGYIQCIFILMWTATRHSAHLFHLSF